MTLQEIFVYNFPLINAAIRQEFYKKHIDSFPYGKIVFSDYKTTDRRKTTQAGSQLATL